MTEEVKTNNTQAIHIIIGLIAGAGTLFFLMGGGIEKKVANDSIDQYNMVKRNGSLIDACVHAGIVAAAFLQAKDESSYQKWKDIEESDCRLAGVPR